MRAEFAALATSSRAILARDQPQGVTFVSDDVQRGSVGATRGRAGGVNDVDDWPALRTVSEVRGEPSLARLAFGVGTMAVSSSLSLEADSVWSTPSRHALSSHSSLAPTPRFGERLVVKSYRVVDALPR